MKKILTTIWNFIKKILGIKPKVIVTPTPTSVTPKPTPTITIPVMVWYVLRAAFITTDLNIKLFYSRGYQYFPNQFNEGDRVLDNKGRMFTIEGYVTQEPTDGEIVGDIEKTLLK